jgi:hypothetical protein
MRTESIAGQESGMATITPDDYFEIQNLVARYFHTVDNGDAEGFMGCWVEPEVFELYVSPMGRIARWQELHDVIRQLVGPDGSLKDKRHFSSNVSIKAVDPATALVMHDMIVCAVAVDPVIVATGRYNDSVAVKTDRGWKFKKRVVE